MRWIGNEKNMLVHMDCCEYAMKIVDAVEFDELYHALSSGYEEAGCCLTDRSYQEQTRITNIQHIRRQRFIGATGCSICGETRCVQLAHIVPRSIGGAMAIPLCPNHHKAYDEGCLTERELERLSEITSDRISKKTGATVYKMHGMVAKLRSKNKSYPSSQ